MPQAAELTVTLDLQRFYDEAGVLERAARDFRRAAAAPDLRMSKRMERLERGLTAMRARLEREAASVCTHPRAAREELDDGRLSVCLSCGREVAAAPRAGREEEGGAAS